MIHITKNQTVAENPNLKVAIDTGDYDDSALIDVYDVSNPEIVSCSFQAQYVMYGGLVYKCNSPQELGIEILKIDPESTHTAASYVRMSNQLLEQMNQGSLEIDSLDEVITAEQSKSEEKIAQENENITEEEVLGTTAEEEIVNQEDVPADEVVPTTEDEINAAPLDPEIPSEVLPVDDSTMVPTEIAPVEAEVVSARRIKKKIA